MKESHSEDQASHAGPESCEGVREGALEALTGEPAGRAIEPRNQFILREADLLMVRGRQHRARRQGEACPVPARSENLSMWGRFSRGSREISGLARRKSPTGPRCESLGSTIAMNDPEKSDRPIVSKKRANKAGLRCHAAEPVEKRGLAKGSSNQQTSRRTQSRGRLQQERFTTRQTASPDARLSPEAGAQCGSSACWDLCGGCRVTGGPTATLHCRRVGDLRQFESPARPVGKR